MHDAFNEFVDKIKEKFNQLKQIFHKPSKEESSETSESPKTGTESESEQESPKELSADYEICVSEPLDIVENKKDWYGTSHTAFSGVKMDIPKTEVKEEIHTEEIQENPKKRNDYDYDR